MQVASWNEIESMLQRLAVRAVQVDESASFYGDALRSLATVAQGAASVWLLGGNRDADVQLTMPPGAEDDGRVWSLDSPAARQTLIDQLEQSAEPLPAVPPQVSLQVPSGTLIKPVAVDRRPVALLEIQPAVGQSAEAERTLVQIAEAVVEIAADWHRNHELNRLRRERSEWSELLRLQTEIALARQSDAVWHVIANATRSFVDCDRVSVLIAHRRRSRVVAVSGLDTWDPRSAVVRSIQQAVDRVSLEAKDHADWHAASSGGATSTLLPEVHEESLRYFSVDRVPASDHSFTGPPIWLVCESFTDDVEQTLIATRMRKLIDLVLVPTVTADGVTARHASLTGWLRRGFRWIVLLLIILAMFAPVPFRIRGDGQLIPAQRAEIFAPADADVAEILIADDQSVAADVPLIRLRNDQLDLELSRVLGERQTAESRLATIRNERVRVSRQGGSATVEAQRLSGEEVELTTLIEALKQQQTLIERQREELTLTSPIAGSVTTWDYQQLLEDRPVRRGQRLLSIVDLESEWFVEVLVPDEHIGFVRQAWQSGQQSVNVALMLATDPEHVLSGTVRSISPATELNAHSETVVRVRIELQGELQSDVRPGATVIARFDCGVRSAGFVLFHDLLRRLNEWRLF